MNEIETPRPEPDRSKWRANHNARRKEQYDTDPAYRAARLEKSRESYRGANGVVLETCLRHLGNLSALGELREVTGLDGTPPLGKRLCFSMKEFGETIGHHKAPVIYRWRTKGLIPAPIAEAPVFVVTSGRAGAYHQTQTVYLGEEVEAMVKVIGEHQKLLRYFRKSDTDTIDAVFAAVETVRRNLGV